MLVLGIESSCDEIGIAIYNTKYGLISNQYKSQINIHKIYGGVVPEIASRNHINDILKLIKNVLHFSFIKKKNIEIIVYTKGPGLTGPLLIGSTIANSIAMSLKKPILGINHLEGHLLSPLLTNKNLPNNFIALLISGGNTQLIHVRNIFSYKIIGKTLDNALGETFDKIAKLLGLSYPGGPKISNIANYGKPGIVLPKPMLHSNNLNFSFSGLKTATLLKIKKYGINISKQNKADISLAFINVITEILIKKSLLAMKIKNNRNLVIVGGVSSNIQIRKKFLKISKKRKFTVFYPDISLCNDNGAMIAFAGALKLYKYPKKFKKKYNIKIKSKLTL